MVACSSSSLVLMECQGSSLSLFSLVDEFVDLLSIKDEEIHINSESEEREERPTLIFNFMHKKTREEKSLEMIVLSDLIRGKTNPIDQ